MTAYLAHRGGPKEVSENSLKAFNQAILDGYAWMELDIRVTKDDRLVVFHDPVLGRKTNARGFVDRHTLQELKSLRLDDGQQIPTLKEVLLLVDKRATLLIHMHYVRKKKVEKSLKVLMKLVEELNYENHVVIIGFKKTLKMIKEIKPEMKTSLFSFFSFGKVRMALKLNADFIQPMFGITKRFVKKAKMRNVEVITWPVKKESKLNKLVAKGVTHILTKFPVDHDPVAQEKED